MTILRVMPYRQCGGALLWKPSHDYTITRIAFGSVTMSEWPKKARAGKPSQTCTPNQLRIVSPMIRPVDIAAQFCAAAGVDHQGIL
jgi:hypothetical protein